MKPPPIASADEVARFSEHLTRDQLLRCPAFCGVPIDQHSPSDVARCAASLVSTVDAEVTP